MRLFALHTEMVSNVNINETINSKRFGAKATITAVRPPVDTVQFQ